MTADLQRPQAKSEKATTMVSLIILDKMLFLPTLIKQTRAPRDPAGGRFSGGRGRRRGTSGSGPDPPRLRAGTTCTALPPPACGARLSAVSRSSRTKTLTHEALAGRTPTPPRPRLGPARAPVPPRSSLRPILRGSEQVSLPPLLSDLRLSPGFSRAPSSASNLLLGLSRAASRTSPASGAFSAYPASDGWRAAVTSHRRAARGALRPSALRPCPRGAAPSRMQPRYSSRSAWACGSSAAARVPSATLGRSSVSAGSAAPEPRSFRRRPLRAE